MVSTKLDDETCYMPCAINLMKQTMDLLRSKNSKSLIHEHVKKKRMGNDFNRIFLHMLDLIIIQLTTMLEFLGNQSSYVCMYV